MKTQTVYRLAKINEESNTGIIVKFLHSGHKYPVLEQKAIVFTPEEYKQHLLDIQNKVLDNVRTKTEEDYLPRQGEYIYTQVLDKQSITNIFEHLIKEI